MIPELRARTERLCLALGAVIALSVATGRFAFWSAAWLGPALLTRFLRRAPGPGGLLAGYLIAAAATVVAWSNALGSMSGPLVTLGLALAGVTVFAPYAIDRAVFRGQRGVLATLVLPLAWVTVDILFSRALADVGFLAYSQVDCLPLLQIASVTGVSGVTFVMIWGASVSAHCAEVGLQAPAGRSAALLYGCVLGAVLAFGAWRLHTAAERRDQGEVVGLSSDPSDVRQVLAELPRSRMNRASANTAANALLEHDRRLLAAADREATSRVRIIAWSEASFVVFEEDAARLLAEAGVLARRRHVYLALAWLVHPRVGLVRNELVLLDPDGQVATRYEKTRLSPGEQAAPGDGRLPLVASPYGLLSGAICADFSYHRLILSAGRAHAALLFDPSSEWESSSTRAALFRAVENGAALVKITRGARSVIADGNGRVLAQAPPGAETVLRAGLPSAAPGAIYPKLGDAFAWACVAALIGLLVRQAWSIHARKS